MTCFKDPLWILFSIVPFCIIFFFGKLTYSLSGNIVVKVNPFFLI